MTTVTQEYIELDDNGKARVIGTRSKVRMIAIDALQGLSAEKIHEEYPHLSMAQIHAALAYYYDHKCEIDADIDEGNRLYEEMRKKNPNRFTRAELEARWREKFGTEPPSSRSPEDK